MKQHITMEQIQEIANDRKKVVRIAKIVGLDYDYETKTQTTYEVAHEISRLLTIGKMIEVLERKFMVVINNCFERKYAVKLIKSDFDFEPTFETVRYKELCDVLWEAIKYDLVKEMEEEE